MKREEFYPTHSFEEIKRHREYLFSTNVKPEFINERVIKNLTVSSGEIKWLRQSWLSDEFDEEYDELCYGNKELDEEDEEAKYFDVPLPYRI